MLDPEYKEVSMLNDSYCYGSGRNYTRRGRREPMTGPWKGARLRVCVVEEKPANVKKKRLDREKDVSEEIQSPEFKGETRV